MMGFFAFLTHSRFALFNSKAPTTFPSVTGIQPFTDWNRLIVSG